MLMWADVEREWGLTNPFADPKKVQQAREELRSILRNSQRRPDKAVSELESFREALGPKREKAGAAVAPSVDPEADLAAMRDMMKKKDPADE